MYRCRFAAVALLAAVAACRGPAAHQPPSASAMPSAGYVHASQVGAAVSGTPAEFGRSNGQRPDHILIVIFENKSYEQIIGSPSAPYLTGLARGSALFTNAHAETHPSQPNYIALFSGGTQGVTDDDCPVDLGSRPNLARQLLDAGYSFTGYSEDLPYPGYLGCENGRYAAKHNPWVDFANVPAEANQPATALPSDYSDLPTVAFLIPDLCNDMHDCSVATGDRWAAGHLDRYQQWAATNNSLLIVTFDEDNGTRANHIATFIAGEGIPAATHSERIDHYTLLRTIEDCYELPALGEAADSAPVAGICS